MSSSSSKLWEEKPLPTVAQPGPLSSITFTELYVFFWKLALAGAAFAAPFLLVYFILGARH